MATPDHTVLARPSYPSGGTFIPRSDRPPRSADSVEVSPPGHRGKVADIAIAVYTLERLLMDSDAYAHAQAHGLPSKPLRWPLSPYFSEHLREALYYLDQYARMLGRKSGMSP